MELKQQLHPCGGYIMGLSDASVIARSHLNCIPTVLVWFVLFARETAMPTAVGVAGHSVQYDMLYMPCDPQVRG